MMRTTPCTVLFLVLFAGGCRVAKVTAERTESQHAEADGLRSLSCRADNGSIELVGTSGSEQVAIAVTMRADGVDAADAAAALQLLSFAVERRGGQLVLRSIVPSEFPGDGNAQFHWRIEVPPEVAQELVVGNGAIGVRAMAAASALTVHNGNLQVQTGGGDVAVETHNGSIVAELTGTGPVRGRIATHNGSIDVQLGERSAAVDVSTRNGVVTIDGEFAVRTRSDAAAELVAGEGGGLLTVTTHNGTVRVR